MTVQVSDPPPALPGGVRPRLGASRLGDVGDHVAKSAQLTVTIPKSHQHRARPEPRAVPPHPPALVLKAPFDGSDFQLKLWPTGIYDLGGIEARKMSTYDLLSLMAQDRASAIMPTRHVAIGIQQDNGMVSHRFDALPEWIFAGLRSMPQLSRKSIGVFAINHVCHTAPRCGQPVSST